MDRLREYVLSVAAAALIVGIITQFYRRKDTAAALIRMIGGMFLAFTALAPLVTMEIGDIGLYIAAFSENGAEAVREGQNIADKTYRTYIKSKTEAYILDKAAAFGAQPDVEVTLEDGDIPVPERISIEGSVSPYAKRCLRDVIANDLGILEENQLWIG